MSYDEHSIKIIGQAVADERFGYTKIRELAEAYPAVAEAFIRRLVTAAEMSGWGIEAAEARYLAKTVKTAPPPEFTAIYREIMVEDSHRAPGADRG